MPPVKAPGFLKPALALLAVLLLMNLLLVVHVRWVAPPMGGSHPTGAAAPATMHLGIICAALHFHIDGSNALCCCCRPHLALSAAAAAAAIAAAAPRVRRVRELPAAACQHKDDLLRMPGLPARMQVGAQRTSIISQLQGGATRRSVAVRDGDWNSGTTWSQGRPPRANSTVTIPADVTVTLAASDAALLPFSLQVSRLLWA